jgi:hypothetical protein
MHKPSLLRINNKEADEIDNEESVNFVLSDNENVEGYYENSAERSEINNKQNKIHLHHKSRSSVFSSSDFVGIDVLQLAQDGYLFFLVFMCLFFFSIFVCLFLWKILKNVLIFFQLFLVKILILI